MKYKPTLGDAPIEPQFVDMMNKLGKGLDDILNGNKRPKRNGFILMMFELNTTDGRCNYISNAERKDVVTLLKEQLARFEGQPEIKGHA